MPFQGGPPPSSESRGWFIAAVTVLLLVLVAALNGGIPRPDPRDGYTVDRPHDRRGAR